MCVCIQCFWEWLVQYLKRKPIIRYEQVPFDIDDHIEEEFVQETTQLLSPEFDSESDEAEESMRQKEHGKCEMSVELTSQSHMTLTPYVTAESTDNDANTSCEEDVREGSFEEKDLTSDTESKHISS